MGKLNIYRFDDRIAINPPDGQTFYIELDEAQPFAEALLIIVEDINRFKFQDSRQGESSFVTKFLGEK